MAKYLDDKGLKTFTTKMKEYADDKVGAVDKKVTSHIGSTQNPHGVTKTQVGLGKVTNDPQIPLSQKGVANGVATLGADGKLTSTQMPVTKTINGESIFGSGNITVSASLYKIVDALPTKDIDITKIYLVPATATTAKNNKTEYIYIGDPNKAYDETKWEKLGDEQKSATVTTPGGTITVDTAFIEDSSNPIANKTVTARFKEVDNKLAEKVAQEEYDTNKAAVNEKLTTLENKTITVDPELKLDSTNPVQNKAVKKAVDDLDTKINNKANSTDLTTATGKIGTLEANAATILMVTGEGNGISSISKSGKTITATKGTFITSLTGYVSTGALNKALADYVKSTELSKYYTKTEIDGKGYLTEHQSLAEYVKSTALTTELANYATQKWVGDNFAKGTIPTKVSDLNNDSGFLTNTSLNGYVNTVDKATSDLPNYSGFAVSYMQKNGNKLEFEMRPFLNTVNVEDTANKDGNGIAEVSIDQTKKYILRAKKGKFITEAILGKAIDSYMSGKSYLTEENLNEKLKETVTIKLVSDKSESDTNLNGATVTVKSGDTTVSTQTWQGTPIKVEVPCDKDVTIEASVKKMYAKPKVLTYTPSPLYNREVTFTYKALELGVFVIDINDKLYRTVGDVINKTDIVGALLVTDKVAIVIAAQLFRETKWGYKNGLIDGCTVNSDAITAVQDFAGAANTAAIMKANAGLDTAASKCNDYVFRNGKKGHLMSGGEAIEIQKNFDIVQSLLNDIDRDNAPVENMSYWTSTQKGTDTAWGFRIGDDTLTDYYITIPESDILGANAAFPIYSLYD